MKKKIAILGSTGSIGKSLVDIIKKNNKKKYDVILLTANSNHRELLKQIRILNVKNIIITNKKSFEFLKKKLINKRIKIFNNYNSLDKIFKTKVDYTMSAITGLDGLLPTKRIIKYSKLIAIANKESIICAWDILKKELNKNKTKFIPVDSEHFSIWYALNNLKKYYLKNVYITASGGPLLNYPIKKLKKVSVKKALKHPNWNMGNKISIDSATMMNKVFELIEAKNIFEISLNKISIIIHPKSYVHALISFNNGLIKIIAHDTDMKIPIFNTLYPNTTKWIKSEKINLSKLNNLDFQKVDLNKFPLVKVIKLIPNKTSLFETVLVSANDTFVELFLKKKIRFTDISANLIKFLKKKEFVKYKRINPKNIGEIIRLSSYVRSKIISKSI